MFDFLRYHLRGPLGPESAIDFMKYRWYSLALSILLFATFIGTYVYRYVTTGQTFNYSVDFTGGIQVRLNFNKPVNGEDLTNILEKQGWPGSSIRAFSDTEYVIRVKKESKDVRAEAENIKTVLEKGLGNNYSIEIKQTDSVGSATGSKLWANSFYAIIVSLILMLLYIALRFQSVAYAIGAIVSLFHDAIAILTVFLVFNKEISINVIGAILVVLGYSINDTIVIFARIRENVKRMHNASMYQIINVSITETLSRTILTTFATLLVVVALLIFGGDTLRDLSLALLIGIVFGIYSTIFIATPVLLALYKDKKSAGTHK